MAEHTNVVPTSSRLKIALLCGVVVLGCLVLSTKNTKTPIALTIYSATNHDLDLAVVDGIARADVATTSLWAARAVVVPHHLVAAEAIALGVKAIALSHPSVVVIISPDHYFRCPKLVCTTVGVYTTFFGDVEIPSAAVQKLLGYKDIVATSTLFDEEHGVYSIVPFIKHYLPHATIVPLVISQRGIGTPTSRAELLVAIQNLLDDKSIALVISSDFSHYLPLTQSEQMDAKTQNSFCAGNTEELLSLHNPSQSDCPLCLWTLYQAALKNNFWNPTILWHSNSAQLLGDLTVQETTSHFTFIFPDTPTSSSCAIDK